MLAVAEADVRKLRRDPAKLLSRMVQPTLWLLLFGEVFAHARVVPTGNVGYLDFIVPGIFMTSRYLRDQAGRDLDACQAQGRGCE